MTFTDGVAVKLVVVRPDEHAGGTEIAGNCPPGWVAYIGGALAHTGFTDITFVDALTNHIDDESRRQRLIELDPNMFWQLFDGAPWNKYSFVPPNCRVVVPNFARGCPFGCRFCSPWKAWRKDRARDPKWFVDEIETLLRDH